MLPWLPILRDALDIEFGGRPRVATAATTDADHRPRARSVVIRRIDDDGSLYFVSDARSDKNAQLRHFPYAELVFWLPTPRVQIRLAGRAAVVGRGDHPGLVDEFWAALPGPSRALFAWPAPGLPRPARDDAFILALPASAPAPDNFEVIVVVPDQVEQLELADVPHRRIRWPRETEWQPEDINP
jgi:pyridoxamine 5'-phosphate oxidase